MKLLFISLIFLGSLTISSFAQDQKWYKGNTHMHTDFSDGDSPIKEVVDWYHDHGYNFISITDHNKTILPLDHISRDGLRDDFMMIIGNEITSSVHFTALGLKDNISVKSILKDYEDGKIKSYPLPAPDTTKTGHSQVLINGMLDHGAIVFINHPNFSSGISAEEMLQLNGYIAIELSNAHPAVYNYGNDLHRPVEEKWDYLLTYGKKVWAVGSDDEHHIQTWGPDKANPGRSWIMVEADNLAEENILGAIRKGKFYASTGVEFKRYEVKDGEILVEIDKKKTIKNLRRKLGVPHVTEKGNAGFRIEVIGNHGSVLVNRPGEVLRYPTNDFDNYLRVRASYTKKKKGEYRTYYAWAQPLFAEMP
jgi:hypothetical protein